MATYRVIAKLVTYQEFIVEADSAEAAHEITQERAENGDCGEDVGGDWYIDQVSKV